MDSPDISSVHSTERISEQLRARLLAYPNVTDVGIGLKMKNNVFRSERAIVVYVSQKVPANKLPEDARLPDEIDGLSIDIQEELDPAHFVVSQGEGLDLTRIRPLRSGITISTSSSPAHGGTLGCFAIRKSDQKKVLVSNYHILFRDRGLPGLDEDENKVYQPLEGEHNQVAIVPKDTGSIGGSVDCAFAILGEEGSCCCCTHTIPHENKVGNTQLVGVATAQVDQKVFKTGAKTGATVGKVVNVNKAINGTVDYSEYSLPAGNSFTFSNLIMIVLWDEAANDFDPSHPFTQGGDSGSVIYNENHQIVGLHFLSYFNPDTNRHFSFACHIELVENTLGLTIPGTRNYTPVSAGPLPPALAALDEAAASDNVVIAGTLDPEQARLQLWWQQIELQLNEIETGKRALSLVKLHSYEIMHLVNHNREVMVAWQRGKGPAFVAAIARSIRHEDYEIPREIDGSSILELASKMSSVLTKYGSPELKEAIQSHLSALLFLANKLKTARDLISVAAEIDSLQVSETS